MLRIFLLILRNIRRSYVRSSLTVLGTMVLVFVVTLVWSILAFLGDAMTEKNSDFKAIVTEKWQIPSQMPFAYADALRRGAAKRPGDVRPTDSMTWQFYGGTTEAGVRTRESIVFAFAMEPQKINTMMDELDSLPPKPAADLRLLIKKMVENRQGMLIGRDRLAALNKHVGDRIKLYGLNYKDIDLEFDILGLLPSGRYDNSTIINGDYLIAALDQYKRTTGTDHPLYGKSLNLVWLRVPDAEALRRVTEQIESSTEFRNPQVKCETQSSGIASFMEGYRDLIWGVRMLLAQAIIDTLSLVISTSISIGVRERRGELAVMKVLGFPPRQVLMLVLGEAVLLGAVGGLASAATTYYLVNIALGGLKFPIAFFSAFFIPDNAILWGVSVGGGAALVGSLIPAWTARNVKVAEVFSKVA
jgi:putative ABC transport system permease protein